MPPHLNPSSRNIIPSSGAIHTTNDDTRRTFYYSSLIINNGSQSSKSRWKVHLGDIVAISKSNSNQSAQEVIESWKPNHYVKKSPGWKVGLVIALRKVITRNSGGAEIKFECHVQWLEKSLDLNKEDMKSANLKSIYRPYNTNTKSGSQLPHVLINCPGDYGIVSMIPTDEDYCIILPVNITMKTNRDFMRNGVKEGEESKYELKFCCTKTRRQLRTPQNNGEGQPAGRSIHNEREPDAWAQLNRPGANEIEKNGNDASGAVPQLMNKVPGPLQKAWKGWMQSENAMEGANTKTNNAFQEQISRLGDALMRGWNQSRRERANKFILAKEEQRRKILEDEKTTNEDVKVDKGGSTTKGTMNFFVEKPNKSNTKSQLDVSSTKRKSSTIDNDNSSAISTENAGIKRKKKELRFSADTKQPSSKSIATSKTLVNQSQVKKRPRGNPSSLLSTSRQERTSFASTSIKTETSADTTEGSKRPQRKKGRLSRIDGANDDEVASTTTRDTHSTDTTLPTRGAGRKRKLKSALEVGRKKDTSNGSDCNDNGTETTANTSSENSAISTVPPSKVSDALDKWTVDVTFTEKTGAFHTTKKKRCFRELKMTIPLADPSLRCLLDEDEVGILDQYHSNNQDMNHQQFHIKIGSIVALHYNESASTTNSWSPFRVPWGVAQVTNIFTENKVDDKEKSWMLTIKWFYRYPELGSGRRTKMLESMNKIDGLVETFESCDCSVEELLPAYIDLTSDSEEFCKYPRQVQGRNGFPIVRMLCQHVERSRGKIRKLTDWNYNHRESLKSLPSIPEGGLPGPFKRSLEKMPVQQKKSFNTWFEKNQDTQTKKSSDSKQEVVIPNLDIAPETSEISYVHKGIEYFDSICMNVQKTHLNTSLRKKFSNRWTMAVGHILAVDSHHNIPGKTKCDPRRSYPFQKQWCPAQIVALYKKECGTWMMEIRWFDRFKEVLQQHKENISHLNKSHVVFETEVYDHLPVAAALPGRIILSSIETNQSWDMTISDTTGLPLIPRLCTHMCFDEEIDTCMDWTNYDLNLSQIPPGLSRGLLLRPRNRQKKKLISMLSRYYIKAIKNRGIDPDQNYFEKWSIEGKDLVKKNKLANDRFTADDIEIEPGPHLLTVNLHKSSQEFFKAVTIRSPTAYLVSPTMEMKRRKNHCFDCMVGDLVCFFDNNASAPERFTSTKHLKHPWHPFQIPWSYGQILSIYREAKKGSGDTIKIEMRRFFKLHELSEKAREFLPMNSEVSREEIFESNDVIRALDSSCLLGTANVLLGNHASSGYEKIALGRQKDVTSCRCRFFYLYAFQSLQPIYWSSLYPKGWHQGLQQRGYQQSKFVSKYESLQESLLKLPDKGPILDMLSSAGKLHEEGSIVQLGKATKSSSSQHTFYGDVALHPQWSLFCASEQFSLADCCDRKPWTLQVGDIVAIRDPKNTEDNISFPFAVPWYPGQVLAIFNESNNNEKSNVHFEIHQLKYDDSTATSSRKITMWNPSKIVTVSLKCLLGPLTIYFSDTEFEIDRKLKQAHLPLCELMAAESLKMDSRTILSLSKLYSIDDRTQLTGLIRKELEKGATRKSSTLNAVDLNLNGRETGQRNSSCQPVRVDNFNMRVFYSGVSVVPQCKIFQGGKYEIYSASETVAIGDTIRVRVEGAKRFPYDCKWSIGEVVAIFEKFESKDEMDRAQESNPKRSRTENLKIEIRWFYERHDISMSVSASENQTEVTEVFETDHCQVLDANTAILGHVQLVEYPADVNNDGKYYFLCTRFWSTKRRTLIPCSGLEGRMKRGMIYSTLGSRDDIGDASVLRNGVSSSNKNFTNWKNSMGNLISKLTLKDASKNAYAIGEALVGREKELSQLLSFLRGAFFDDRRSTGYKSSMFLAGPPGVVSFSAW